MLGEHRRVMVEVTLPRPQPNRPPPCQTACAPRCVRSGERHCDLQWSRAVHSNARCPRRTPSSASWRRSCACMSSCSRLHRPRCPASKQETTQQRQQSFRHTQLRLRQRPAPGRFVRRVAGGLGGLQAIEAKNELAVLRQAFDATDRQLRAERLDQKRIQERPPARPSPSHPIPSRPVPSYRKRGRVGTPSLLPRRLCRTRGS
jgi:hypothetical protein